MLTEKEKTDISQAITDLEKKSSAELVAVIAGCGGNYNYFGLVMALGCAYTVSLAAQVLFSLTFYPFLVTQLLVLGLAWLVLVRFKGCLLFLPRACKYSKASARAHGEFAKQGIHRTKTGCGIMFFVSKAERYVEIIADQTIACKIDNAVWETIVNDFIADVRKKDFAGGYLRAIQAASVILIREFPIQQDDENELSNTVIELD